MINDRVIWLGCALLVLVGFVLGANRDIFTNIKITDWLTSIGTIGAVISALWISTIQMRRDTYKLTCKAVIDYYDIPGNKLVKLVSVNVVNIGLRPISIDHISWIDRTGNVLKIPYHTNEPIQPGCRISETFPGEALGLLTDLVKFKNTFTVVDVVGVKHDVKFSDSI